MSSIIFLGGSNYLSSSLKHRCIDVAREFHEMGVDTDIFYSRSNNVMNNYSMERINHWKNILSLKPDFVVLNRSSNLIDYHMIKKLKKTSKIIFDYDDALFNVRFPGRIFGYSHLEKIMKISDAITAGSHYLADYAKKFNPNVFLLPTAVDTNLFRPIKRKSPLNGKKITIGWMGIGSDYQLKYFKLLKKPLQEISNYCDIKFKIVSAISPLIIKEFANVKYDVDFGLDYIVPLENMPGMISDFDIGVMPLTNEQYEYGKCSMKALEYMSMKIPTVASTVGENRFVISQGINGFLANNSEEWFESFKKLIENEDLRNYMGNNAREHVLNNYSLDVVANKFLKIIEGIH